MGSSLTLYSLWVPSSRVVTWFPLHGTALGSNERLGGKAPQSVEGEGVSIYKAFSETLCIDLRVSRCDFLLLLLSWGSLLRNADLTDSQMLVESSITCGPGSVLARKPLFLLQSTRGALIHPGGLPEVPQV